MSFFSYEYTNFKQFLLTKANWWGIIPAIIGVGLSYLLVIIFHGSNEYYMSSFKLNAAISIYAFIAVELIHQVICKGNSNPFLSALLVILIPFIALFFGFKYHGHQFSIEKSLFAINYGLLIWWTFSLIIAIWASYFIWKFAYRSYHYDPSDYSTYILQSDEANAVWKYAFCRSAESFLLTLSLIAPLGAVLA